MKIGIIGVGAVGSAIAKGFEELGHELILHDIKFETNIEDQKKAEIIFICVPTNQNKDGSINLNDVFSVVDELNKLNISSLICIKSTVLPGTTNSLIEKYSSLKICFVPEFLRERCAYEDFKFNHDLLLIGTTNKDYALIVQNAHGDLPKKVKITAEKEAELVKYFSNTFNAARIVFANFYYEICQKLGADYDEVLKNYLERDVSIKDYLSCNEKLRGYGGMCLPKDVRAINYFRKKLGIDLNILETIDSDNNNLKTTVFDGMRK